MRRAFWRPLFEWFKAAAFVWVAAAALIAVGIPLVLLVRAVVNALSWLLGRIADTAGRAESVVTVSSET